MSRIILLLSAISLSYVQAGCQSNTGGTNPRQDVDAKTFSDMIAKEPSAAVIDVRSEGEYKGGYIKGAVNWPIGSQQLANGLSTLDKNKAVYVYCLSGGRSGSVAKEMAKSGFTKIIELDGGIMGWNSAGLPLEMPGAAVPDAVSRTQYLAMISGGKVLVDFYAPWCAPCKKMEPMLTSLQKDLGDKATIVRINVDENKSLVKELGVSDIPVFRYYSDGNQLWQHNGAIEREELEKKMIL